VYWLGIDVGTGGTRALLIDRRGKVRHSVTVPHEDIRMDRPFWAEQDPENWWDATCKATSGVLSAAGISGRDIRGIGLSGQMHGLVTLDKANRVVRPALIWCDQRSQQQVDKINNLVGREAVVSYTANPVLTGFTLPKLLWVRDNEPKSFAEVCRILLPKDFVRFKLTGAYVSDVSDASGTALFDVVHRRWSAELLARLALDPGILPDVVESQAISGSVSAHAAAATGLAQGTPVVGGAGDQAASAIGNGIVAAGVASCTLGTSGVVFAHMPAPAYDPDGRIHTFCHAVPQAWHVMGVTQAAGFCLQWFRRNLAPDASYDALTTEAATAEAGSQGLYWLPYLMGERTPHLDASARGGWIGLTARHKRADLIRALLEGVSFSQKDCLDIVEQTAGAVDVVRVSGGGARSPFWRQLLADILGKRIVTLETEEGSAYGAALLALSGTGEYASIQEVCSTVVRETAVIEPSPEMQARYSEAHQTYRALYPALRSVNNA
jgi:xylulokinase